jgi:A/G-specific adenine glycosylase
MAPPRSLPGSTGEANPTIAALLRWYRPRRAAYPWRGADPYGVWVSEVMLQQTQASRVVPAYVAFVGRFPDARALAAAPRGEVLRAWGSLGYPRRAVALSDAARLMVRDHGARIPDDPAVLAGLPGIGPYTAAAIAALGYGRPVAALDTNVRRVTSRSLLGREPHLVAGPELAAAAGAWLGAGRPGDVLQALMDLGRTVCRPVPRCDACPLARTCRFRLEGAVPERGGRRQPAYAGSLREVRGAVLRALRSRRSGGASISSLAATTGFRAERVTDAVRGLAADGVVAAGPGALAGRPRGRVALPG